MKKIFTHLFAVLLLSLVSASAWAQLTELEVGKVYRFVSARADRSLAADGTDDVHVKVTNAADTKQEWYVTKDGDYYVLRNVACGKYLKGAYSANTPWSMTDDYSNEYNKFELYTSNSTLNTLKTKGSDGYGYMHDDNNGDNGGYNVVGWLNGAGNTGTHWTITKVNYTAEQITELLEMAPTVAEVASYSTALNALFNDGAGACVAPKLSSLDAAKATSEYKALPTSLQAMVDKVYGDAWAEDNADATKQANNLNWDAEYAKKFRVQMYEPYSIAGDITSWLGINSHANNDNPTGIYMPAAGTLFVMVEGEIKTGATLRLVDGYTNRRINGTTTESAVVLKQGLNVINYTGATGMLYICYNVDTYNPNGATHAEKFPRKLSEFAPLKIHIEGGAINGFYNACGDFRAATDEENLWKTYTGASVDADADWEYMETRANLSILPILGHREILLLQLEDEQGGRGLRSLLPEAINCPSTPYSYAETWADYGMGCDPSTGKINIVMEAWDRIFYSQLATMGLVSNSQMERMNDLYPRWTKESTPAEMYDYENKSNIDNKTYLEFCQGIDYSEYFNHHGIILGTSSGNPYAAGDHVGYPIGGFGAAVYDLPNTAGSTWGPAHEIGHQHQGVFTLNGLTEVTNNLFSNISLWYKGMSTSRYNGSDGSLESVLNAFNTNGSDIYTNNIWALTHLYYRLWLYYHLAGNNTQFYPRLFELLRCNQMQKGYNVSGDVSTLHFYKLACQAAGEDLTEFFRVHGYFSVMEDRFVGDYSNSIYNVSQAMIDEAIAEVKAMRDAEGNPLKENLSIIFINDDDETATYLQHDGESAREIYGETKPNSDFGSVTDFIAGNVPVETTYTATLSDNGTITMSGGEGGVGFLIVNEKGEIISFSNKATFALSDKAMEAIVSGNATIKAVDSQSNVVEAEVNLTALQKGVLGALISKAQSIVDKVDDTYTKIGYFKEAAVAGLESSLAYAKEVYAGSSGYEAAYDLLYAEYAKVLENKDAKIPFNPSLTYIIKNKAYSSETMWVNGSGVVRSEGGVDQTSNDARWKFVETSTAGVYNIRTLNNKYIPAVQQSASMNATSDKADNDALYTLEEVADGVWAIKLSPAAGYRNLHSSWSNVVGWETGADASRWYLTAVAADPVIADLADLEVYINKTEQLLDEVVGAVTYTKGTPLSLQTTTQNSAGYLWSNAPEDSEGSISYLVDGTTGVNANYFHTEWSSEPPSGSHYLAVYLGEGNDLSSFTFSHTTRSGASTDFPKSVDVYGSDDNVTYKYIGSASGMPQSAGTAWEFNGVMQSSYKYLRFNYHASRGYWHMAEFDITPVTGFTATVNDAYSGTVSVDAVTAAMNALHNGKRTANSILLTTGDIDAKLQALQSAYNTLYEQYKATIDARKATLAQLAAETEALMNGVGTVTLAVETPITLTTSNFYCNAPYIATQNADYSAEYVSKLTDKNSGTYLHTRWNTNSDDGDYHYLRVDAGETTPIDLFYFTYTTASRGKKDMPLTMVVEGANEIDADNSTKDTFTEIATLTPLPEVLNKNTVYESSVLGSAGTKYRYLRFKVTDITADEDDKNGHPFFTMSEFGLTSVTEENVTVNNAYKSCVTDELLLTTVHVTNSSKAVSTNELVTSVPLLDAQIADQQAAKAALEEAMAKVIVDKTALQSLYDDALELYGEMADTEGHVNSYYEPSALTNEKLIEVKAALDVAKEMLDNGISQTEIDAAKTTLQEQYDALLEIKNSDFTGRDELNALIGDMQSLLGEVADKTTAKTAIALQTTDANAEFYIWSNAKASDCDGDGASALIDKNNDGTANTGTFFGTVWQGGAVTNYSHYITVDLGTEIALSELSIDYTTRNSTHANQRPTSIKILGSNDKEGEYVEITHLSEGMPVGQCAKWEMDGTVALNGYYRYIRFAVATEKGYFNMSDFNLYAHSALVTNSNYQPAITGEQLYAMNVALLDGIAARDKFVTEDNYNAAVTALQAQYDALLAIKNANKTDKDELETLVTETNELVTEVATVNDTETAVTMQCTDENASYYLYCNAPGKTNNYGGDNLGVAALLDNDSNTFLHTTYNGNDYADDLDHYLRLDMGENEALAAFKFNYVGRVGNTGNAPKTIVIEGSNDRENFEEITTLKNLPTADNATYQSDVITNGKAYRYIRFMVTETSNGSDYNGHDFFALSHFSVTACKTINVAEDYVSPNLPLSTLATANNEVVDGTTVKEQFYVTQDLYDSTVAELQAAKDALAAAIALKNIPVKLTTDVNNPVLYKIKINRNGDKRLQYDAASAMVAVADEYVGNKTQAWFFMSGADDTKDVLILPYTGEGKVLATNSFSEGDSKVQVVESTADGYSNNWNVVAIENSEWSNITILNGSGATFYFSNYGGDSKKMGFYNTTPSTDGGSMFQFILDETDYSLSDAYYALYNQYVACGGEAASGEVIGTYTVGSATEYNDAYNNAAALIEAKNSTDEVYNEARTELVAAYGALEYNGGLCKIRSAFTGGYSENKLVYVDAVNNPYFEDATDEDLSKYVWEFVPVKGGYHLKSLHTQSYITAAGWGELVVLGEEAAAKLVTVDFLDKENGIVRLNVAGGYPLHAQNSGSKLVGYTGGLGTASAWYIEEIEDVTTIKHTVTMSATFSSVMLGYNATVPAGVEAYNAEGIEEGYVTLVELAREGEVIPANTPVILYRTDANTSKTFTYTRTEPVAPASTVLGGSLYQKFVKCDSDKDYYKLMIKGGEAKMYWMYKEFNAAGESLGSTNDGGHIKCSANKIYMALPQRVQAASFGMRFKDPETTGVDEVKGENGEVKTIYDLQGRKLAEITQPGFYIVNGKKVYVK
ncbi:MAG: discoidin domain-containing protein [Bacteroidaceae bacterium]|nr:discoidin domain-containing protein [Bacteroidaceae bacterium]